LGMGETGVTASLQRRRRSADTSVAASERHILPSAGLQSSPVAASSRDVLPATSRGPESYFAPSWLPAITRRIAELSLRREGWDSYGAAAVQPEAIGAVVELVLDYGAAIQTEPVVSLTVEGGLLFEWGNEEAALEYTALPNGSGHVYF